MKYFSILLVLFIVNIMIVKGQTPGTVDITFGTNGFINTNVDLKATDGISVSQILRQTDGKYLAVFATDNYDNISGVYLQNFYIYRFEDNGKVDAGYGINGRIACDFSVSKFFLQNDGKLLVCGIKDNENIFARFLSDGKPDTEYGFHGINYTGLYFNGSTSLLLQNGKILISGSHPTNGKSLLARLETDGNRDFSFGTDGIRYYDYDQTKYMRYINQMNELSDGKILMGTTLYGNNQTFASIIRLNSQFNYDSSFSNDGEQILNYQGFYIQDFQLTGDSKVIVTGFYYYNNYQNANIVFSRLKSNGTPDSTFGVKSTRLSNFGGARDFNYRLIIQPDGKPITAGSSDSKFGLLRLSTAGNNDASFNITGKTATAIQNAQSSGICYLEIAQDGKLLVAGYAYNKDSTGSFILSRYHSGYNTSVENYRFQKSLSLYPNPVNKSCILNYMLEKPEIVNISIYDISGKVVLKKTFDGIQNAGHYSESINTEYLQPGIYILSIENSCEKSTIKLIKE